MENSFEKEFMSIQEGIISLCLEATKGQVDKIFGYGSIEEKTRMFNVFFEKAGEIITLNKVGIDLHMCIKLLKLGVLWYIYTRLMVERIRLIGKE